MLLAVAIREKFLFESSMALLVLNVFYLFIYLVFC